MPKTVPGALATHLGLETTSLATLWEITRTDGVQLFSTDHDEDITFEGDLYEASISYDTTAISNTVGLSVDNLDVAGFLDSSAITEAELRGGLYDKAKVKLSIINWDSPTDGVLRMRTGELGEVEYTNEGGFSTELRGLAQLFSQNIVEVHQPICRADLGDSRCKIELFPDVVLRNTAYIVDDVVRSSSLMADIITPTILLPFDVDSDDISANAFTPSLNQGTIDSGQSKFGGASKDHTTAQRTEYADDPLFHFGANDFTIDFWVRNDTISATFWGWSSQYESGGNDRAWWMGANDANFAIFLSNDGGSGVLTATFSCAFTFTVDTWYHVAVTRDSNKVVRMYVDGTQVNGSRTDTIGVGSSTTFTRTVGSWLNDGFRANQKIVTTGFTDPANNGSFTVSGTPTATTLTITTSPLVTESGTGDEIVEMGFALDVFNSVSPLAIAFANSTPDFRFDGWIDDYRIVNGTAVWTGTSFTVPASAHTVGITQALIDSLITVDFDDRVYTCTVAGTTNGAVQPVYDTDLGDPTVDGTCTFVAGEAFTRAGIVSNVVDNRIFSMTFPNVADTRETVEDWFKYGAVKWETGNNLSNSVMEVKASTRPIVASTSAMGVTDSNTFNRATGSFLADGYVAGMEITTLNFTNGANNGTFTISSVAALTLDTVETTLVSESAGVDEVMTSGEFISLFLPMSFTVQVGDTFSMYAGCDKLFLTCRDKFMNIENRRAEDYIPSKDKLLTVIKQE